MGNGPCSTSSGQPMTDWQEERAGPWPQPLSDCLSLTMFLAPTRLEFSGPSSADQLHALATRTTGKGCSQSPS